MSPPTFYNVVNGRDTASITGQPFENRNPADGGESTGHCEESGAADASCAVAAASEAFPRWRDVPAPRRAEILYRAAQILAERKEELARDMTREMGKVLEETRGDVQEAIDMAYFMAGEGRRLYGQTTPSELPDKFCMTVRMPVGVCALITPWNFPMAIPSWKILPALVCGNTVVIKPSSEAPLGCWNLVKILHEAGLPAGVLNLITGGAEAGEALLKDPAVRLVSFTGSAAGGRHGSQGFAPTIQSPKPRMGGKNLDINFDEPKPEPGVRGLCWGRFGPPGA